MGNDWTNAAFAAADVAAAALAVALMAGEWMRRPMAGLVKTAAAGAVAALAALCLTAASLGRPALLMEVLRDPRSLLFWKTVPPLAIAAALALYVTLQYRGASWRAVRGAAAAAGAFGLIAAAALGVVQKLPLRPMLDTNLPAFLFLSFALSAAAVLAVRSNQRAAAAAPWAAAVFFLVAAAGYGALMVQENEVSGWVIAMSGAIALLTLGGLWAGATLSQKPAGLAALAAFPAAALLCQLLMQRFMVSQWHFF